MLRFTLLKVGRKKTTDYRIVVREKRSSPRSQKYIESVGTYNTKTKKLALKNERVSYWLSQGVQPSGTVHNMLVNEKIISGPKMAVTPHARPQTAASQNVGAQATAAAPVSSESSGEAMPASAESFGEAMPAVEKETALSPESNAPTQEPDKKPEVEEQKSA